MIRVSRSDVHRLLVWLTLALAVGLLLYSVSAWARPVGGHTYSGGSSRSSSSSSSGGGGGGGGGDASGLIFQLTLLCIQYPALGVPLLILVILFFVGKAVVGAGQKGWSTTTPDVQAVERVERTARVGRAELDTIRALDPGFSLVLFEDFVYMLYAAVQ